MLIFHNVEKCTVNWDLRDTAYKQPTLILWIAAANKSRRAETGLG